MLEKEFGFVTVRCEELTLSQQADLFKNSSVIVGATGAAWTNLMFANPGLMGLCWMPSGLASFANFSNLAAVRGVRFRVLPYESNVRPNDHFGAEYRIDPHEVGTAVSQLLSEQ
jgi:hypothetical protein